MTTMRTSIRESIDISVEHSITMSVYDDIWTLIHIQGVADWRVRHIIFDRCHRVIHRFLHRQAYNSVSDYIIERVKPTRHDRR
jgi:hypothetical protein